MQLTDEELLTLYRFGQEWAFKELYERHGRAVLAYARRMVGDHGLAEEITQDAFLRMSRAADRYESRGQFKAWLSRITTNLCLNQKEDAKAIRVDHCHRPDRIRKNNIPLLPARFL